MPQISAGNTFQAKFGAGVFAAMIRPATPQGRRTVMAQRCGVPDVMVRPNSRWPSPAKNRAHCTAAATSPRESGRRLPASSATTSASSRPRASMALATACSISPRLTPGVAAQAGWAAVALATARSTSAGPDRASLAITLPEWGDSTSISPPPAAGTGSPPIRLAMAAG